MANERKWLAVTQLFTADGTTSGVVKVPTSRRFKVKAKVILQSNTQPQQEYEVKNVPDHTTIEIGPCSREMDDRSDLSMYTLADNAKITQPKQKRPGMGPGEIDRAVYEEEPTVARRVFPVDDIGNGYTLDNPFPVQLSDGSINIGTVNAELEVYLSAKDDDPKPGDVHDSVRIGDGADELAVNNDGSINVNVISSPSSSPGLVISHNEVSSVIAGSEVILVTIIAPPTGYKVYKIDVSGENVAIFKVKIDGVTVHLKRTFFGLLNESFTFEPFDNGLLLPSGKTLTVTVLHQRPSVANFEVTVMGISL